VTFTPEDQLGGLVLPSQFSSLLQRVSDILPSSSKPIRSANLEAKIEPTNTPKVVSEKPSSKAETSLKTDASVTPAPSLSSILKVEEESANAASNPVQLDSMLTIDQWRALSKKRPELCMENKLSKEEEEEFNELKKKKYGTTKIEKIDGWTCRSFKCMELKIVMFKNAEKCRNCGSLKRMER